MDNEDLALYFPSNFLVLIILSHFLLKSIFSYSVIITIYIYNSLMSRVAYSDYISFFYKILFSLGIILIFIFVGYSVCIYVSIVEFHITSPFFQVKELPVFNLVPFFKCGQVYGQCNGNKMSCGSSQEIFLSHCWLMPFAPFFQQPFLLPAIFPTEIK